MNQTRRTPPFPDERITPAIVTDLYGWGWNARLCPICGQGAAVIRVPDHDAVHMCCSTCQKYTMTGPCFTGIEGWAGRPDEAELKGRLSAGLAASNDPTWVNSDTLWALANTTPGD